MAARFIDDVLPERHTLPARERSDKFTNALYIDISEDGLMAAELMDSPLFVADRDLVVFDHPTWS